MLKHKRTLLIFRTAATRVNINSIRSLPVIARVWLHHCCQHSTLVNNRCCCCIHLCGCQLFRLCLILSNKEVMEEALVKNSSCFAGREMFYVVKMTNEREKGHTSGLLTMNGCQDKRVTTKDSPTKGSRQKVHSI